MLPGYTETTRISGLRLHVNNAASASCALARRNGAHCAMANRPRFDVALPAVGEHRQDSLIAYLALKNIPGKHIAILVSRS